MFEKPSDLFRWCLLNTKSGSDIFSWDACFPRYKAMASTAGYLWEKYDERLLELINGLGEGRRVLEVGCGFGHDLVWAATSGVSAVGIDVNSDFVEITKQTKVKVEEHMGLKLDVSVYRKNLLSMTEEEKFDLIFMKDVFHHLEPREKVVEKLVSLLASRGRLIIVEPNALNPLIQLQMFRIRGFKTIIEKTDPMTGERYLFGNERLVTGGELCRLFKRAGLNGSFRLMRLLPTRLAGDKKVANVLRVFESLGFEKALPPACIHSIYVGYKGIDGFSFSR